MKTIFVSSTFKDFQAERDILNNKVRPQLCIDAGQYGEAVSFCDLRWGIDTTADSEEAATQKILSVCMDQIDRSSPYMIVLLGERYGYIPGQSHIRAALDQRGSLASQLEDLEISITQLEIEYGLLTRPENKPHVYIYVRRIQSDPIPEEYASESAMHKEKMEALLQRILRFTHGQVRYYDVRLEDGTLHGLTDFAELVRKDLSGDLREEWEAYKDMPPFEKERLLQWQQIDEKKNRLRLHKELSGQTITQVLSENSQFLAIQGSSGCGKSVLLSYICHSLREQGMTVIPALCQSSPITGDPSILLEYLIFHLENALHREHITFSLNTKTASLNEPGIHRQKIAYLERLCSEVPADGPKVIIALDALDQIYTQQLGRYNTVLPNTVSKGVRILVTAVSEFKVPAHFEVVNLKELSADEILPAIRGIEQNYKKDLSSGVCQALSQRASAGNLLYLTMIIMRLCLMNRDDFRIINSRGGGILQIERRQQEIVAALPDKAEDLAVELLESVAAAESAKGLQLALNYLAVSRGGLRMVDLEALLRKDGVPFIPLDLYVYIHMLQEFFMVRQNGCIDFQHKIIRCGLLGKIQKDVSQFHQKLFDYLHSLPAVDPLRNAEIVYHAYYAGQDSFIPRHIATVRTYDYYRTVFRMAKTDLRKYAPADFSMDVDYGFLCQQLAADLHTIIMDENIAKIENVISMLISLPPERQGKSLAPIYWAEFLNRHLPAAFGETDEEMRMLYTVFSCMEVYTTELCTHFTDPAARKNLALCHLQLARLESKNTNRNMNRTALKHIRTYVQLLQQLAQERTQPDPAAEEELVESQEYLMLLLLQGSRQEDMAEVLDIGSKLLIQYEALGKPERTSRAYFNMGLAYEYSGGDVETRENAFQHYMRAIELSMRYAEEKGDSVSITYRILSTIKMGNMCLDVGNHSGGMQMFSLAYQYAQAAYEQLRDNRSRQYVLMAQEGIGMCLMGMGDDSREQGKKLLMGIWIQGMRLLKEFADPGLAEMCQRIHKQLT